MGVGASAVGWAELFGTVDGQNRDSQHITGVDRDLLTESCPDHGLDEAILGAAVTKGVSHPQLEPNNEQVRWHLVNR
ncbi:hypothetical protein CKAH01_04780 [Colletotrichum kahawae]|uniref:Uncharacterized protein n=1 Tax=Colletotrichum kahawae TaxID=34407 RepID=A0AAE0D884_COLKA|nr:hypothetical protein CKAH01_04780 [Colletotrichum kahawae]